jgi:rare lipoprotein A
MKRYACLTALLLVTACSSTPPGTQAGGTGGGGTQQGYYKIGNPYEINGVTYVPKFDPTYDETGIASWYAGGFDGEKTANGELYDSDQLTAAHRTLPLPSLVRVTNLDNGRALILRVNDRGPFSRARIIDVSKRAAELLGFKDKGTAKVRVQIMVKESEALADAARRGELATTVAAAIETNAPPTATPTRGQTQMAANDRSVAASPLADQTGGLEVVDESAVIKQETGEQLKGQDEDGRYLPAQKVQTEKVVHTGIYIQAGAFSSQDNALHLKDKLQKFAAIVEPATINGQNLFRVRIGPIKDVPSADSKLTQIVQAGVPEAKIIVE